MTLTQTRWPIADARWPPIEPERVLLRYDAPSDTLYLHLHGAPRAAVTDPLGIVGMEQVYLRIVEDTDEVVGVMVRGYLGQRGHEPAWLELAPHAGVTPEAITGAGLPVPHVRTRDEAIARVLSTVQAAWAIGATNGPSPAKGGRP